MFIGPRSIDNWPFGILLMPTVEMPRLKNHVKLFIESSSDLQCNNNRNKNRLLKRIHHVV